MTLKLRWWDANIPVVSGKIKDIDIGKFDVLAARANVEAAELIKIWNFSEARRLSEVWKTLLTVSSTVKVVEIVFKKRVLKVSLAFYFPKFL